jgi:hypothetical protein
MRRTLAVTITVAGLAAAACAPVAHSATACPSAKQGNVVFSKLRATKTTCPTATKIAKAWAKGLKSGTSSQRHCAPAKISGSASCTVSGYSCRVTAQPTAVAPAELATCKRGQRKVSWRADFS